MLHASSSLCLCLLLSYSTAAAYLSERFFALFAGFSFGFRRIRAIPRVRRRLRRLRPLLGSCGACTTAVEEQQQRLSSSSSSSKSCCGCSRAAAAAAAAATAAAPAAWPPRWPLRGRVRRGGALSAPNGATLCCIVSTMHVSESCVKVVPMRSDRKWLENYTNKRTNVIVHSTDALGHSQRSGSYTTSQRHDTPAVQQETRRTEGVAAHARSLALASAEGLHQPQHGGDEREEHATAARALLGPSVDS